MLCGGTSLRECSFAVDRLAAKLTLPECHLIANLLSGDTPFLQRESVSVLIYIAFDVTSARRHNS